MARTTNGLPSPRIFRDVLSTVPTGVVVITAVDDGDPVGLVVGTFTSVSLDPPLVGFLPAATSTSFPRVHAAGRFCANVLTVEQQQICRMFAASGGDKFAGLHWTPSEITGSPVLEGVAAWVDCSITTVHEAGDHLIVIGAVEDVGVAEPTTKGDASSLVFYRGAYSSLR
ncbi:monooxygenase [Rhodococcus qingshengii]|uniref:flavin reductase family protein n=1 Tax=Rhodococcus qingshengii TaxID=334542 RepID=UPI0007E54247|nr:flavin reductase family protein [Rhodococcus qingshengii]BCF83304.1 monooxygenase [Rhodococcus qingshengii]